jgi:type IV secretory pathway VirB10-like protein
MAIANVQKEMLSGGKTNLVGDLQLYNTAAELTRIMGHKNPDKFFNDPAAINPQTGQLLHPPPAPRAPPPDPKLLAARARAQTEQAIATHKAQIAQQEAQHAAVHLQVKAQTEAELAKLKADLDAKLQILDAHIKAATAQRQPPSIPGARKARDGHHYLSDPKRPGKFLMVVHHG